MMRIKSVGAGLFGALAGGLLRWSFELCWYHDIGDAVPVFILSIVVFLMAFACCVEE